MARGDHPERTPVYGWLLIVAAMLAGLTVQVWTMPPIVVHLVVGGLAVFVAIAGVAMTVHDRNPR